MWKVQVHISFSRQTDIIERDTSKDDRQIERQTDRQVEGQIDGQLCRLAGATTRDPLAPSSSGPAPPTTLPAPFS